MQDIEERETHACIRCGSTLPLTDHQIHCNYCDGMEDDEITKRIVDQRALIKSVAVKKHQYSKGVTISCEINESDYFLETVFEKSFMYEVLSTVSVGDFIILSGFIEDLSIILTSVKNV